jgi:putative transposase
MFLQISGCCRFVYNNALEAMTNSYAKTGSSPHINEVIKDLPALKQAHVFLKMPPAQTLQACLRDLADAYSRFFKGQNKRPTWRSRHDDPSFRLPQPKQFTLKNPKGTRKNIRHLHLPKMGMSGKLGPVAMVQHRPIDGKICNLTITREGGIWFASFCVKRKHKSRGAIPANPGSKSLRIIGADMGINHPVTTSQGTHLGQSVVTPARLAKMASLAASVSRKLEALRQRHAIAPGGSLRGVERGSSLKRAEARLSKFYGKMARIRKDQAHKISRSLVSGSDVLVFEDLDTRAMTSTQSKSSSKDLRRQILDVSWAQIIAFATYKAAWDNKTIVRVNPAYTSQMCSGCGYTAKTNRKRKSFECRSCGHKDHADINAAKNIKILGIKVLSERSDGPCLRPEEALFKRFPEFEKDLSSQILTASPST